MKLMTRTMSTRIVIVLAAIVAITAVPSGPPASALLARDVPIQPGAPIIDSPGPYQGSFCTLNFVFKDKAKRNPKTYIGTATECTAHVGERVRSPQVGAFGTVVFRDPTDRTNPPFPGQDAGNFALIQIDRNKLKYVSRVVRGFGAAPTGYTRSWNTNAGDRLVTHGYPWYPEAAEDEVFAVTRFGVLGDDTPTRYWSSIHPNIQDRGAPVIRADGKAVGMSDEMSSVWATNPPEGPTARYPTIEGLMKRLRAAGFNVRL